MKIPAFFLLLLFTALSTACCTRQAVNSVSRTDSVFTEIRIIERDTLIVTPLSEVKVEIPINQLIDQPTITNKKGNSKLRAQLINDTLRMSCVCDTLEIQAKIKDTYDRTVSKTQINRTVIQEKKVVPFAVKFLAIIGGAALTYVIGIIVLKIIIKNIKP